MRVGLLALFLISCVPRMLAALETEMHLGRFSHGDMGGWKEQTIGLLKTKTTYALAQEGEQVALVGRSSKAASGLIYKLKADPKEYPVLKWSWKIDRIIRKGDERTKEGDDFAARVYVLFPRGLFSETRAICYVWANRLPRGEHVVSPYTRNVYTVAVDSGPEQAGRWIHHQRNVHEDYRKLFGEEPPQIGAVALMTDTDNTGESAVGYYGDISLLRTAKAEEAKPSNQKQLHHKEPKPLEHPTGPLQGEPPPAPAPHSAPPPATP